MRASAPKVRRVTREMCWVLSNLDFIGFASRPVLRKCTAKLSGMQVIENTKQAGAEGTALSHHSWWFSASADGEAPVRCNRTIMRWFMHTESTV